MIYLCVYIVCLCICMVYDEKASIWYSYASIWDTYMRWEHFVKFVIVLHIPVDRFVTRVTCSWTAMFNFKVLKDWLTTKSLRHLRQRRETCEVITFVPPTWRHAVYIVSWSIFQVDFSFFSGGFLFLSCVSLKKNDHYLLRQCSQATR